MTFVNEVNKLSSRPRALVEPFVLLLAPYAPHIAEEIWNRLGHETSLMRHPLPEADPAHLVSETIEVPVQVNGKVLARLQVDPDTAEDEIVALAKEQPKVQKALDGKDLKKVIYVPKKIVSIAAK